MKRIFVITGTDTGAGKTVLTALLAAYLRQRNVRVAALKPICSGGREDARILQDAQGGGLSLDQINPWHFRAAIAPALAAQREGRAVKLAHVVGHIQIIQNEFEVVLVEGAGGLLSPLGADFNSRDMIAACGGIPVIAAPNRLGAVNQVLLTCEALPRQSRRQARVVLFTPATPDSATASNARLLQKMALPHICRLPWFEEGFSPAVICREAPVQKALAKICR